MARKPHMIRPLTQRLPATMAICVQACRTTEYKGDADEWGEQSLTYWHACALDMTDVPSKPGPEKSGKTAADFWHEVENIRADITEVLIVSVGAREHAAALGLWDCLLDGTFCVKGFDPRSSDRRDGYVVLESPPTIIRFWDITRLRGFTWIDPKNFGANVGCNTLCYLPATENTCLEVAHRVADWLEDYNAALRQLGLGGLEHTAASQAAAGYRLTYMHDRIFVHDNEAALNLERAALYGGRTECRFIGELWAGHNDCSTYQEPDVLPNYQAGLFDPPREPEPEPEPEPRAVLTNVGEIFQYDFNSLYPAVARDGLLPVKLRGVLRSPAVSTLLEACRVMPVIATVRVQTDVPCIPVWVNSHSHGEDGKSITGEVVNGRRHCRRAVYPTGDFFTVLCGPEILLASTCGNIVSCGMAALYDGRHIYRRWVDTLYAARKHFVEMGTPEVADCIKAIMNASFAKWAQRSRKWVDVPGELCPWPWDQFWRENKELDELEQWRCFAWNVQRLEDCGEPGDSVPAITAYINSLARVKLYNALWALGDEDCFYYDTDSVWVTGFGKQLLEEQELIDESALGKLKLAGTYSHVEFFGLKRYMADGELTIAGADGQTVRTSDAWAVALRSVPTHSYLRANRPPGIDVKTCRFRLNTPYRHGSVDKDGWVRPWSVFDR